MFPAKLQQIPKRGANIYFISYGHMPQIFPIFEPDKNILEFDFLPFKWDKGQRPTTV